MKLKEVMESGSGNLNTIFKPIGGKNTNLFLSRLKQQVTKQAPKSGQKLLNRINYFTKIIA